MSNPTALTPVLAPSPLSLPLSDVQTCVAEATQVTMNALGLPFDLARAQYARAVQVGLIERSMLASRDFARALGAMERLTLGLWARRV